MFRYLRPRWWWWRAKWPTGQASRRRWARRQGGSPRAWRWSLGGRAAPPRCLPQSQRARLKWGYRWLDAMQCSSFVIGDCDPALLSSPSSPISMTRALLLSGWSIFIVSRCPNHVLSSYRDVSSLGQWETRTDDWWPIRQEDGDVSRVASIKGAASHVTRPIPHAPHLIVHKLQAM